MLFCRCGTRKSKEQPKQLQKKRCEQCGCEEEDKLTDCTISREGGKREYIWLCYECLDKIFSNRGLRPRNDKVMEFICRHFSRSRSWESKKEIVEEFRKLNENIAELVSIIRDTHHH